MSEVLDIGQLASALWWQARELRAHCVRPLVSTNRMKSEPTVWRLEAANGARVAAKHWPDEERFRVERAVLEALAEDPTVSAPRPICFDTERRIGLLEWCGDASLPDCLVTLTTQAGMRLLAKAMQALVGLERWVVQHQPFLQTLAVPYSPVSHRDPAADLCRAFVGVRAWRGSGACSPPALRRVRQAAEGIARIEAAQAVRWGVDDLLLSNVVVDVPSTRTTLVDFEWVGAGTFAGAVAVFACELEPPPGRHALSVLDEGLLGVLERGGGHEFLARPDGVDAAQVLDCSTLVCRWLFIRYLLRLVSDGTTDSARKAADTYGPASGRLHAALLRYAETPLLSQLGPASEFRSLFLEHIAL